AAAASPVVNADRTVTLRFRAPDAKAVTVIGELDGGKTYPMTKDASGIWSVTFGPLAPDIYNYQFNVDGVVAMDPQNPEVKLGFGTFPPASMFEIPESGGPAFDDVQNVPHGTVRIETYPSKTLGGVPRTLWVYTPPGYDTGNTKYPVFYLLHGSGNVDSSWMLTGRANYIMDNLIAAKKAVPMIIVNPLGYARPGIGTGPSPASATGTNTPGAGFQEDLLNDIIPYVQGKYRALTDADHRALGGLSMGGIQTVQIGFSHTDIFHNIVVMSGGAQNAETTYPDFFKDPAATNKKLKLLWTGIGSDDNLVGAQDKALEASLNAKGINHKRWIMQGQAHVWVVWRHALAEVAPQLFK
ncbi:MAG: hypothetical protein JWM33_3283, partial [Caulobacteraceae bacterium]|nr:hypothetical protein [Caulobacteraceae bacterium]